MPQTTNSDIYHTAKKNIIYVFLRRWKTRNFILKRINKNTNVKDIELLGSTKKVTWIVNQNELTGILPTNFQQINNVDVHVLKIKLN